jgi:hypothetical protein
MFTGDMVSGAVRVGYRESGPIGLTDLDIWRRNYVGIKE